MYEGIKSIIEKVNLEKRRLKHTKSKIIKTNITFRQSQVFVVSNNKIIKIKYSLNK